MRTAMAGACPKCGWQLVVGPACPRCGVEIERYRAELRAAGAATVVAPAPDVAPPAEQPVRPPAGFWIRAGAVLIDAIALVAVQGGLRGVAWLVFLGASPRAIDAAAQVFGVALWAVYPVVFHWLWGQTLGKMAVQIRVVTMDGGPLSLQCAIVRQLGAWLSSIIFGIGYLLAGVRADKRALHDLIAGTRVERLAG
jgi:uncharacterized RDD family membrane protein YckC